MTTCTFDGTTVQTSLIRNVVMVGTGGYYKYEVEVECKTKTYSDYTALAAKAAPIGKYTTLAGRTAVISASGTKGTLIINGDTYTNCYIEDISSAEIPLSHLGAWTFTIKFVRHTAS